MKPQPAKKQRKNPQDRVDVMMLYLNSGNTSVFRDEFYALLKRTRFVARVVAIHEKDLIERRRYWEEPKCLLEFEEDSLWKGFTEEHLADWLFNITNILTMQADFLSRGFPMSHAQLVALMNDAFLNGQDKNLRLKDGRNEIWTANELQSAINLALPEIKTNGAVTLTNLAKKINANHRESLSLRMKTRLTGKHLQKLLKKHNIDWIKIKRSYKERLLVQALNRKQSD